MRHLNEIIVHCSATRPKWMAGKKTSEKVAEIRHWHVDDNKWSDIGYHFLIDRDGTVANGRPIAKQGAHVQGHNKNSIGVCLIGGHGSSETDDFAEHFTVEQDAAARNLIEKLKSKYNIAKVTGHNQYAAKACPGFNVPHWITQTPLAGSETSVTSNKPTSADEVLRNIYVKLGEYLDA